MPGFQSIRRCDAFFTVEASERNSQIGVTGDYTLAVAGRLYHLIAVDYIILVVSTGCATPYQGRLQSVVTAVGRRLARRVDQVKIDDWHSVERVFRDVNAHAVITAGHRDAIGRFVQSSRH